jgi:hypothetical protein
MTPRQILGTILMVAACIGGAATLMVVKAITFIVTKVTQGTPYSGAWHDPAVIPQADYVLIWIAISITALAGFVMFSMPAINAPRNRAHQ